MNNLDNSLKKCISFRITEIIFDKTFDSTGSAEDHVYLTIENKVKVQFVYWRLLSPDNKISTSFEKDSSFVEDFSSLIKNRMIDNLYIEKPFNDLIIQFEGNVKLQLLSLTKFEDWIISFPDGIEEYSNFQN